MPPSPIPSVSALVQPLPVSPESFPQSPPWAPGCHSCPLGCTLLTAARDIPEPLPASSPPSLTLYDSLDYYLCA